MGVVWGEGEAVSEKTRSIHVTKQEEKEEKKRGNI